MSEIQKLRERLNGLGEFCQNELWPSVDEFESQNKVDFSGLKSKAIEFGPLLVGGFIALKIFERQAGGTIKSVLVFAAFGSILIGGAFISREVVGLLRHVQKRMAAKALLISEIKLKVVRFLDPRFQFEPHVAFPEALYRLCQLLPQSYDRATAEDRFSGVIGKTKFEFQEIGIFEKIKRKGANGKTRIEWKKIFRGLFFQGSFNKTLTGHTTVKTDSFEQSLGLFARSAQRLKSTFSELKLVELENPEFEAHFKVHTTNPIEARYILTPLFMEKILELKTKRGVDIQLALLSSQIIIAIPHDHDFFEMGAGLDNLSESVEKMAHEVVDILSIIEDLDLDNRISKTEQMGA